MLTRILFINGSPRVHSNSSFLLEAAKRGVLAVPGTETDCFSFAGREVAGCHGTCCAYCKANGRCITEDDLTPFSQAFWQADGVIWAVPTYHAAPPAQVKAVLDRLPNLMFSYTSGQLPRFNKAWGVIVHGTSRYGGQELNAQFLFNSALQLKCVPVAGDSPGTTAAVIGRAPSWEPGSIREDAEAMAGAENLGHRVAEMAQILKAGLEHCRESLDPVYDAATLQAELLHRSRR